MVYLKDEATGVTVEDMFTGGDVGLDKRGWTHPSYATAAEADALLRGLLRWKLMNTGNAGLRIRLEGLLDALDLTCTGQACEAMGHSADCPERGR